MSDYNSVPKDSQKYVLKASSKASPQDTTTAVPMAETKDYPKVIPQVALMTTPKADPKATPNDPPKSFPSLPQGIPQVINQG